MPNQAIRPHRHHPEVGFGDTDAFLALWLNAFVTAFPVLLAMALLLTTVIKPKLETVLRGSLTFE